MRSSFKKRKETFEEDYQAFYSDLNQKNVDKAENTRQSLKSIDDHE